MADEPKKEKKGTITKHVEFALYSLLVKSIRAAAPDRVQRWGERLGRVAYRLISRRTKLARHNLALVFPEKTAEEREAILRACWNHYATTTLQYVREAKRPLTEIAGETGTVGLEGLKAAAEKGRGVMIVSAHFGTWESGVSVLGKVGPPVMIIARALDNPLLNEDLIEARTRSGFEVVDKRGAGRDMIRALTNGSIVVLLVDQAMQGKEAVLSPFLGRPAWTTTGPAKMAMRYKSAIVMAWCYPDPPRVEFEPPIWTDELPPEEQNLQSITDLINEKMSKRILERPELWLWLHDRWKGTDAAKP